MNNLNQIVDRSGPDLNILNSIYEIDAFQSGTAEIQTKENLDARKIEKRQSENERFKEDTILRIILAKIFTVIIALWLLAVVLILVGNYSLYHLDNNVLITLLTTSTINVIGMMLIILQNLFPNNKPASTLNKKVTKRK